MLVFAFDVAILQEPLAIAGLVFAALGATLWFGALALEGDEARRVQAIGSGLSVLSPIFLAWPLLLETGTIAWWLLIGSFALLLTLTGLTRLLLSRSIPSHGSPRPSQSQKDTQGGPTIDDQKEPEVATDVDAEQHPATVGAGTLSAGEKSLANAVVAVAVGLMLLAQGLRILARGK